MVTQPPSTQCNISTIVGRLNAYFPRHGQLFSARVGKHHKGALYGGVYRRGNDDKPVARIELEPSGRYGMAPDLQILGRLTSTEESTLRDAYEYAHF